MTVGVQVPLPVQGDSEMDLLFYLKPILNNYIMQTNKILTLKDFDKVLVSYLKNEDKKVAVLNHKMDGPDAEIVTIKGERRAVLVAIAPGVIGWSLCNQKGGYDRDFVYHMPDRFDKATGISIALKRAQIAAGLSTEGRVSFYEKIPFTLEELADKMHERSYQYFDKGKLTDSEIIKG